jgi:L-asparagine transporter-like permease
MDVQISAWGVILATLSAMVVGGIWYSKGVFGKQWSQATGVSDDAMKKERPHAMPVLVLSALVTAYVLAHLAFLTQNFYHYSYMKSVLLTAFWLWIGISVTSLAVHEAFEKRHKKLLLINIGNRFATYLVMALILGWVGIN